MTRTDEWPTKPKHYIVDVYDGPDKEGKLGFEVRWLREDGKRRAQFFRANLAEYLVQWRAEGIEVTVGGPAARPEDKQP